jgi:hypothetical protein
VSQLRAEADNQAGVTDSLRLANVHARQNTNIGQCESRRRRTLRETEQRSREYKGCGAQHIQKFACLP